MEGNPQGSSDSSKKIVQAGFYITAISCALLLFALLEITDDKFAILQFGGGCQGCGMVDVTLKDGIEKTLLEQLPELAGVRDMTDHSLDENAFYREE